LRETWLDKRVDLTAGEIRALNRAILEDDQFLEELGLIGA
jgi:hypothetical protein